MLQLKIQVLVTLISLLLFPNAGCLSCIKKDFGHGSVVCVCNATYCDTVEPNTDPGVKYINLYTSSKTGARLTKSTLLFEAKPAYSPVFQINKDLQYQNIIGFGGAFTDAAGININSLPLSAQQKLLESYYSPYGIEYTVGRIPIASCDFSTREYSYDDSAMDFALTNFSLAVEDIKYKIPIIQKALSLSKRNISIFGSPWSAPAWMKTNNKMIGKGSLIGQPGGKYFKTWANYFVKFLQSYKSHNITIWGLTAQNEPLDGDIFRFPFQSMGWTPEMQRDFIIQDLGPALHQNGFEKVKLMILDDQRFLLPKWTSVILSNSTASQYISGTAIHWYLDRLVTPNDLEQVHNNFPDKFLFASEACSGELPLERNVDLGNWQRAEDYTHDIIQVFSNPNITKYVQGVALHWYYDFITPSSFLSTFHQKHPNIFMLATEACAGSLPLETKVILGSWDRAEDYAHSILNDINHWVTGWTDWNIALDMQGGPNWVSNFVDSPVIVNSNSSEFYKQPMFYALGHFSKFVLPGSTRIDIKAQDSTNLEISAFLLPDKSKVVVILNKHDKDENYSIGDPDIGFINNKILSHSIQTLVWWNH